ncbi:MAG: adenosylcobalamin-dependent ribonucleoside-diphosphate reductase [Telluria sp.]|nr:adenosylcobalamin-dependent ribonucleoside-diphosphate reductase [Telluria sp.]
MPEVFTEAIAEHVWNTRYRSLEAAGGDATVRDSWSRIALALSAPEERHRDLWTERFEDALAHFRFLPGGRIWAGAGSARRVTLFNCFVMGHVHDALDAIFSALGEAMVTLQAGGGVGCDFSTLRPAGSRAEQSGNVASGPVSFMQVWDHACAVVMAGRARHGAMMATLRCDHPDIRRFIDAKREPGALRQFNLSVLVSDAFMQAVEEDRPWPLVFPLAGHQPAQGAELCTRIWSGSGVPEPCVVHDTVPARELWERIVRSAFEHGEPGVIFIDHVESANNLWYAERLSAVNPCGEVPLPPHGACNLGSINLTQFIQDPFGAHPRLDLPGLAAVAEVATRMLDNVYEVSHFPLKAQARAAHASRRLGLGVTGLADAFAMLGIRYGSSASLRVADTIMRTVSHAACRASVALAQERGAFPDFRSPQYLAGQFILTLPRELRDAIALHGIRNSHLTAIAPAGSISLLANNVSSGVEPIYAYRAERSVRTADGKRISMTAHDYAWKLFRQLHGEAAPLPDCFAEAREIDPHDQLLVQARLQAHVDQAISKTINIPEGADFLRYRKLFAQAWELGLKGCTVFPSGHARGAVLTRSNTVAKLAAS